MKKGSDGIRQGSASMRVMPSGRQTLDLESEAMRHAVKHLRQHGPTSLRQYAGRTGLTRCGALNRLMTLAHHGLATRVGPESDPVFELTEVADGQSGG